MIRFRKTLRTILIAAGILFSLYPAISSNMAQAAQNSAISTMKQEAEKADSSKLDAALEQAREWNAQLLSSDGLSPAEENTASYEQQLDWMEDGIMGILNIPRIQLTLPIAHGTSEETLATQVGHVSWSSLPCGGQGSRTLLSSHRGMASASLFTRLDELKKGDLFLIENPKETLAYQVISIDVVQPEETEQLNPEPGKDLASLITCTPYGINTHRLIVTGQRVEWQETPEQMEQIHKQSRSHPSLRQMVLDLWWLLLLVLALFILFLQRRKSRRKEEA